MQAEIDIEKFLIPRRLDDKGQLLFWDVDTAMIFIITVMFSSMMFDLWGLVIGLYVGVKLVKVLANLKEMGGKQVIMGVLYWYTPSDWWPDFKQSAKSYVQEYSG